MRMLYINRFFDSPTDVFKSVKTTRSGCKTQIFILNMSQSLQLKFIYYALL